jgi:hypothetical protein
MVGAQLIGIDRVIRCDRLAKGVDGKALLAAGQASDDGAFERAASVVVHGSEASGSSLDHASAVILFRPGTLQQMKVERSDRFQLEAQRERAVGQRPSQIGPRPVEQRHEIVGDNTNVASGQVAQAGAIGGDHRIPVGAAPLDLFMHGQTFDDAPAEPGGFDHGFALGDRRLFPHSAVMHFVQRGNDFTGPGLPDVAQRHGVGRPEPAHGLRQHRGPRRKGSVIGRKRLDHCAGLASNSMPVARLGWNPFHTVAAGAPGL